MRNVHPGVSELRPAHHGADSSAPPVAVGILQPSERAVRPSSSPDVLLGRILKLRLLIRVNEVNVSTLVL